MTLGRPPHLTRVITFAPDPVVAAWIEAELSDSTTLQAARSIAHVVAALVEDPPPRPQIMVTTFDAISPGDLLHLHTIREQGWFGTVIALDAVPFALRKSLVIDHMLVPPRRPNSLRNIVLRLALEPPTTRMPKI